MRNESFEQIVLPPLALEALFRQTVLFIPQSGSDDKASEKKIDRLQPGNKEISIANPSTVKETILPTWENGISGLFQQRVLVVTQSREKPSAEETAFLQKILDAVKLNLENDIAWLQLMQDSLPTYNLLKEKYPARVALYFGIEPATIGVPMRFPAFQVQPWGNCVFLFAPSLHELNGETATHKGLKKNLWEALKKIFHSGNK